MKGLDHRDIELELFVGHPLHLGFGLPEMIDQIQKFSLGHGGGLTGRHRDQQVAEMGDQIRREAREVFPGIGLFRDDSQGTGRVPREEVFREPDDRFFRGEPEDVHHVLRVDFFAAERDHLVEHALGVAEPALGTARDRLGGGGVERDLFALRDKRQVLRDQIRGDPAEVEPLAPAGDRGRELLGFGRREDEFHVRRRFLERLEQGVKGAGAQHVDFVDEVNFIRPAGRHVGGVVAQVADVFDAVVARAVDLDHVEAPPVGDFLAGVANPARRRRRAVHAVERLGQDPRCRCLPDPARPDKQVGLREPVRRNTILQRAGDVVLPDHFVERLGTVFSGKNSVAHARTLPVPHTGIRQDLRKNPAREITGGPLRSG